MAAVEVFVIVPVAISSQAAQATVHMRSSQWASIALARSNLIAVCFTGELRVNVVQLRSIKEHFLDPLRAANEVQVFLYTSGEDYSEFLSILEIQAHDVFTETRGLEEIWADEGLDCDDNDSVSSDLNSALTKYEVCRTYRPTLDADRKSVLWTGPLEGVHVHEVL